MMLSRTPEAALPTELSGTVDMNLRASIDVHTDPAHIVSARQRVETIAFRSLNPSPVLRLPGNPEDDDTAIVILPAAPWTDRRALKTQMTILQGALQEPRQVLAVPHNVHRPELMRRERYAEVALDGLQQLDIKEVDLVTFESSVRAGSLMADVATERNDISIKSLTAFEPPNVVDRSWLKLLDELRVFPSVKAMKAVLDGYELGGIRELYPQDAKFFHRGLKAAQRAADWQLYRMPLDNDSLSVLQDSATNTLNDDLSAVHIDCIKAIVRAWDSGVCPTFRSVDDHNVDIKLELAGMGREILTPVIVSQVIKRVLEPAA